MFSVLSERTDVQFVVEGGAEAFTEQLGPTELALSVNLENEHELVVGSRYEMTVELTDRVVNDAGNRVAEVIWFRELS